MRAHEFIIEGKKKPGTFAGVRFSPKTKKDIAKYIKDNDIPNPVPNSELHCTLLYSKKHCPDYKAAGKIDPMYKGTPNKFAMWGDDDESVLVLKFDCPELTARHKELMKEHDATFDYASYKPHLTLSYNAEGVKIGDLPAFTATIEMVEEYGDDIEEEWAEDLTEDADKLPFPEVVELFKKQHHDKITRGCKRGECAIPASYFSGFAREHGYTARRIDGFFKVDNPEFDEMDFHIDELDQMEEEGLNPESREDRKKFAIMHDMIEELKMVPHQWNEYKGKIIDFTAPTQFIDTGLAADTKRKRYFKE